MVCSLTMSDCKNTFYIAHSPNSGLLMSQLQLSVLLIQQQKSSMKVKVVFFFSLGTSSFITSFQATTLNCSHSFCAYCIHTWFKRKNECPNCRVKTTSHNRSIVLDNYIDKMIEKLGDEAKQIRKEVVEERKGE